MMLAMAEWMAPMEKDGKTTLLIMRALRRLVSASSTTSFKLLPNHGQFCRATASLST